MTTLLRIRAAYGALLTACGLFAGGVLCLVMLLVVANAVLRYAVNSPIAGTLELTESALPLIVFLSLALTQFEGGHIKVAVLTQHLSPRGRQVAALVAMLLGAGLFAWAAWASWNTAVRAYGFGEMERGSIRFPLWPVRFVIFAGLAMLSLQFVLDALLVAGGGKLRDADPEEVE